MGESFEAFWKAYPRKVGKLAAQREWQKLRPGAELVATIMASLAWQVEQWDDPQFIPHPRTWLHAGRYLDEPPQRKPAPFKVVGRGEGWRCRHLEHCDHPAMCALKDAMPETYPVRESA
jgi:hypothetical protein